MTEELLQMDIEALPDSCHLLSVGNLSVYCVDAEHIPTILLEIGRLREAAFQEGGSTQSTSMYHLDHYDDYYAHLFVWNHQSKEVVSAYRLGFSDIILKNREIESLYISSLYHVSPEFFATTGPVIELGRTFVRREYQKSYAPLLLLWRGLGEIIRRNPQYRYFYGLISLSKDFSIASLQVMIAFFKQKMDWPELAQYVWPHHIPDFSSPDKGIPPLEQLQSLADLYQIIQKNEKGLHSLPVLLTKYLQFDTKFITFGLRPALDNCLDCVCITDMATSDHKALSRYLGIKH